MYLHPQVKRVRYTETEDLQGLYLRKYGYLLSVRTHKTIKQDSRLNVITNDARYFHSILRP